MFEMQFGVLLACIPLQILQQSAYGDEQQDSGCLLLDLH